MTLKNIKKNNIVYLNDINLINDGGGEKSKKSKKSKKINKSQKKRIPEKNKIYLVLLLVNMKKINLYVYKGKEFVLDNGNLRKILDKKEVQIKKNNFNKIYGMLKYENGNKTAFKILDTSIDDKKSRKGVSCSSKMKNQIITYLKMITNDKINNKQKNIICGDLEYSF